MKPYRVKITEVRHIYDVSEVHSQQFKIKGFDLLTNVDI